MNRVQTYIFMRALKAFVLCITALIGVVWITQALQQLDLMTNKGQTILIFFQITWLILPKFIAYIAPVAALLATLYTLNSLNKDSELVIMVNSGASPFLILKPLLVLAGLIALMDASVAHYFSPTAQRQVRHFFTEINSDLISSVIKPGEFASIDKGITFYVGSRDQNGLFKDVFVSDNRAKDQTLTYLAQNGAITRTTEGTFFVLQNGTIHRRPTDRNAISVIDYSSYAFDLSTFERQIPDEIRFRKPSENYTPYLYTLDENNSVFVKAPGKFYSEFHNRLASPFYALTYVLIAYFFVGRASNTRQGNALAIVGAVLTALFTKGLGVTAQSASESLPTLNFLQYFLPLGMILLMSLLIWKNVEPRLPTFVALALSRMQRFLETLTKRRSGIEGAL